MNELNYEGKDKKINNIGDDLYNLVDFILQTASP